MVSTKFEPEPGNTINQHEGWDELRAGDKALDARRAADLEAMAEIRLELPDESEAVGREWASMRLWPHVEAVAWLAAKRPDLMEQIGAYRHYWHDLHRHDPDAEHMAEQACWSLLGGRLKPGEIRAAKELLARHVAGGRPILDDGGRYIADEVRRLADAETSARGGDEASAAKPSTAKAVEDCKAWLRLVLADPIRPGEGKAHFQSLASEKFGDRLSGRGFRNAWAAVAPEFPERRAPGPKG